MPEANRERMEADNRGRVVKTDCMFYNVLVLYTCSVMMVMVALVTNPKTKKDVAASNVRLPGELLVALRKEQAPYLARGEEAPTFGEMLMEAWKAWMASRAVPRGKG